MGRVRIRWAIPLPLTPKYLTVCYTMMREEEEESLPVLVVVLVTVIVQHNGDEFSAVGEEGDPVVWSDGDGVIRDSAAHL